MTITADDQEVAEGSEAPELTYTITAGEIIAGDDLKIELTSDYNTTAKAGETFTITVTCDNVNYEVTAVDGTLTVTAALYTVSGNAAIYDEAAADVTIQLFEEGAAEAAYTATTDNTGAYSITGVVAGDYTLKVSKAGYADVEYAVVVTGNATQDVKLALLGDVNLDEKVDMDDVVALQRHIQGVAEITDPAALAVGEVDDADGLDTLTRADANKLIRFVLRAINTLE